MFAALLNLAVLARFVWPELLSAKLATAIWALVGIFWLAGLVRSIGYLTPDGRLPRGEGDTYAEAMQEYLRGHWYESEAILRQLLMENSRDLEARLLLSSVLRHTGRYEDSERQLGQLERLDGSQKWRLEILQERSRLQQLLETEDEEVEPSEAVKAEETADSDPNGGVADRQDAA